MPEKTPPEERRTRPFADAPPTPCSCAPDVTRVEYAAAGDGLHLAAERARPGLAAAEWSVRLPEAVRDELDRRLPGQRSNYLTDHRLASGSVILEGLGDDLDAVRAGLETIARSCADFLDRLHVARLAVVGELGDAPKIALRARLRPEDVSSVDWC